VTVKNLKGDLKLPSSNDEPKAIKDMELANHDGLDGHKLKKEDLSRYLDAR
jgi:hypothetical protein